MRKLPKHVFERYIRIKNDVFQQKINRKIENSVKQKPKLDWVDMELELAEFEEKLKREVLK